MLVNHTKKHLKAIFYKDSRGGPRGINLIKYGYNLVALIVGKPVAESCN